jgi:hypothetical protein
MRRPRITKTKCFYGVKHYRVGVVGSPVQIITYNDGRCAVAREKDDTIWWIDPADRRAAANTLRRARVHDPLEN